MTVKEFYLKLFTENNTALASAIILIERFVNAEQLIKGEEYIRSKVHELYEEMPEDRVKAVFPDYKGE